MVKETTFSTFQDVTNPALRAWNQLAFVKNLDSINNGDAAEVYFESLPKEDKLNILVIGARIQVKGEDFVRNEVFNTLN